MLEKHYQSNLSFHSQLYELIPKDHFLVKVNELIDFSYIYKFVKPTYNEFYGRRAVNPEILFRLLFIQNIYNLSDERVIKDTQVNLAYKWFLGLNPEDSLPDSSLLSIFRVHKIGAGNVETLLTDLVKQCVEKGLIKSSSILIDATHTKSKHQADKPLQVLKKAANRLLKATKKYNHQLVKKLPTFPELPEDKWEAEKLMLHYLAELGQKIEEKVPDAEGSLQERLVEAKKIVEDERLLAWKGVQTAIDPDARFGWKSNTVSFLGYKESLAMTEDGIITGVVVEPGSASDPKALPKLIQQTEEAGVVIKETIADTAYSTSTNLELLETKEIDAIMPLHPNSYGMKDELREKFIYHKDSDTVECPMGHHSYTKRVTGSKKNGESQRLTFYFDTQNCKECPLQNGCYQQGAKSKSFSLPIIPSYRQKIMDLEKTEEFKIRYKCRYKIEQKNHELKNHHGLAKTKFSRGLLGMRIQSILTCIAVNVKKVIKINEGIIASK